jgi:hypothetical protein
LHEARTQVRFNAAVIVLLAALLIFQLLVPPILGLADQGDYGRLWTWFGIDSTIAEPDQRFYRYLIRQWQIDPSTARSSEFVSPELLFVAASTQLNALLFEEGVYDIRALAAIRILFGLLVAYLLIRVAGRRGIEVHTVAAAALLFVFADAAYIAYFNSGYTESGSLLFGLLTIAIYARFVAGEGDRMANLLAFVASSALLIWSKPQNVILAAPLAFLALRLAILDSSMRWRVGTLAGAAVIVVSAIAYRSVPPPLWYKQSIRHIAVFNSMLPTSPDPVADLRELGAEPTLASLSGRFPWDADAIRRAGELQYGFYERVDDGTIAAFYLRHPDRMLPLLKFAASESLAVQLGVGHYEAASGAPPYAPARGPSLRSEFVKRFGPHRFRWIVALLGLAVAIALVGWRTAHTIGQRLGAEGILMLALAAALQYVTVAVLQGPQGVAKGMLLFAFLYDATMVAAVALVVHRWAEWRRSRLVNRGPVSHPA